jgi:hypothetical protein
MSQKRHTSVTDEELEYKMKELYKKFNKLMKSGRLHKVWKNALV